MKFVRKLTAALVMASVAAFSGIANADNWDGGGSDSEFSTGLNWDTDLVPVGGATSNINGAFTVDRSVTSTTGRTFVNGGAILNVTGGTHNNNISGASRWDFVGGGSTGAINQSAGTYEIGHGLRIGSGNASSDGTYNLTGGTLNIYRGANSAIDANNPGGRPSLEVGSQTIGGSAIIDISGGNYVSRFGAHIGATGVFSVTGSGATSINIGNDTNGEGVWLQRTGSTLAAAVDAGGLTKIFVDDNNDDGAGIFAEFETGSLLDLSFDGIAPVAGTWTVLELENGDIEWDSSTGTGAAGVGAVSGHALGLGLSPTTSAFNGTSGWTFDVDNSGPNGLLTATYTIAAIPEPSSLALLGLGGLFFAGRRRR